jgi:hypothetical protein
VWFGGAHGAAVVAYHKAQVGEVEVVDDARTLQRVYFRKPTLCSHATETLKAKVRVAHGGCLRSEAAAVLAIVHDQELWVCVHVRPGAKWH